MTYSVSLRYRLYRLCFVFVLFCLCYFIQKKYLCGLLCVCGSQWKDIYSKILLSPALHLGPIFFFFPSCHRIQRHTQNGYSRETTACFYKGVSPGSCEETIVLVNWIRPKGPTEMPLAFLVLDLFPRFPWFPIIWCSRFYSSKKTHTFIYPLPEMSPSPSWFNNSW